MKFVAQFNVSNKLNRKRMKFEPLRSFFFFFPAEISLGENNAHRRRSQAQEMHQSVLMGVIKEVEISMN